MRFHYLISVLLAASLQVHAEDANPMKDDVKVTLPCGSVMVFRKVHTSAHQEKILDQKFSAGESGSQSRFAQDPSLRYIQGGFRDKDGFYYLMGKYEVSAREYQELSGKCPAGAAKKTDGLPVVSLSWFDAMAAARALSNHLQTQKIPELADEKNLYARLPTDAEWEFAARGGLEVSQSEFEGRLPPMEGKLSDYAWYQGAESANGHVNLPGRLKPNALGIYDMLGNVQEMILEPFRATRTGRLHGLSGGFTVRGGGYLTPSSAIASALRTEKPYFVNGKELTSKDLGFRLVIGTSVAQSAQEIKQLNSEIEKLGTEDASGDEQKGKDSTVAMMDKLIAQQKEQVKLSSENKSLEESNRELRENNRELTSQLEKVREQMVNANSERDEMRDVAVIANLRLGGFLCKSMADEQSSLEYFEKTAKLLKERCAKNSAMCASQKAADNSVENSKAALKMLATYYGDTVAEAVANYDLKVFAHELAASKKALASNRLADFIDRYLSHLSAYQSRSKEPEKNREFWIGQCHALSGGK